MIQFGVAPRTAIATNMVVLVLMSLGSSLGFRGQEMGSTRRIGRLVAVTIVGSVAGALLMLRLPEAVLRALVPGAMIAILLFLLVQPRPAKLPHPALGYGAALLLAVYGGLFSGGYVIMLVAAFTYFFGYAFLPSIALARLLNAASASVATAVFAFHGAVDWKLGGLLGGVALVASFFGARLAKKVPETWLRRLFTGAVALLALKSLFEL